MLKLFINTDSIDKFLVGLSFFNMILIIVIRFIKREIIPIEDISDSKYVKKWVSYVLNFWNIIFSLIIVLIPYKFSHNPLVSLIIIISIIILFFKTIHTDFFNSNLQKKYFCVLCSFILIIFFKSDSYDIYRNNFYFLSHSWKEALLILYIILKIIVYIYFVILNISILMSLFKLSRFFVIVSKLISIFIKKTKKSVHFLVDINNKIVANDFSLKIILTYTLFFPFFFICIFVINILTTIFFHFTNIVKVITNLCDEYIKRSKYIIWTVIKISLICSLVIVYFVVISDNIFSDKVVDAYNFLATVVLIPLLLSSFEKKVRH